jgi:hypothetical protein
MNGERERENEALWHNKKEGEKNKKNLLQFKGYLIFFSRFFR